jgi:chemotaxis protein methyltransferase CheR
MLDTGFFMNRQRYDPQNPQMTSTSYGLFRNLILERTGMHFPSNRRDAMVRNVLAAADGGGFADIGKYYRRLFVSKTDSKAWDELIQLLIINETYFFRETPQMDALRNHILPEIIARHHDDRCIRIWSAGCASGEEPYSLAILLYQLLPDIAQWNVFILGTDINKRALLWAKKACYGECSFRVTDPSIRERFFTPRDGVFEIKPPIREMVHFAHLNLSENVYPSPATFTNAMDLILCRNVAIYFEKVMMREMALRFHRCLVPDGWFIVGAAEAGSAICDPFIYWNSPGAILYRKGVTPPHRPGSREMQPDGDSVSIAGCGLFTDLPPVREESVQPLPPYPLTVPPRPPEPEDAYEEGLTMIEKGNDEGAIERFQARIAKDPKFVSAYCGIARVYANRGRLKEADAWCEKAVKIDPLMVEAYYILALIRQEEGAYEKAVELLKRVLYLDSNFVLAHFNLAVIHRQTGRRDEAMRHHSQALRLSAKLPPDQILPGADGMTAAQLLAMIGAMK